MSRRRVPEESEMFYARGRQIGKAQRVEHSREKRKQRSEAESGDGMMDEGSCQSKTLEAEPHKVMDDDTTDQ